MSQIKLVTKDLLLANNDILKTLLKSKLTSVTTMPTLTEGIVGNTYLYTGTTTVDFTTNTIYKAISDGGDPATLSWQSIELGSTTISDVSALPTGSSIEDIFYRTETATPYTATVGTDFLDDNTNFTRTSDTYTAQSGVTIKVSLDNGTTYKDFTSLEFDGTDWTLTADGETATLSDGDTFYYEIINYSLYAGNSEKQITERIALYEDLPDGVIVDSELSSTSENPVQNKIINSALNTKLTQVSIMPTCTSADVGKIVQYIGQTTTTVPIYTNGYFYKCTYNSTDDIYEWVNIPTQEEGAQTIIDTDSIPVGDIENVVYRVTDSVSNETSYYAGNEAEAETERLAKYSDIQFIQVEILPTADASEVGNIYQYIGATENGLVKGFFYICQEVADSDPIEYEWVMKPVQDMSGTGELAEVLNVSKEAGGIEVGTSYAAGTVFETLWRDLLNPLENPTLTAPSASLASSIDTLLEAGTTTTATLTATFNRGSIDPANGTDGYRAGEATNYTIGETTQASAEFTNIAVDSTNASFTVTVAYGAGTQPKDSRGGNYSTPLEAGTVTSPALTYEFVDALWANTASIGTIAKLALVSKSAKSKEFVFPAATVANPEVFDVPATWTVAGIEIYNTLSGKWETCASEFTATDTTHENAAGTETAYKRYTCNLGYNMASRQIKLKWN